MFYLHDRTDKADIIGPGVVAFGWQRFPHIPDVQTGEPRCDLIVQRKDRTSVRLHPSLPKEPSPVFGYIENWYPNSCAPRRNRAFREGRIATLSGAGTIGAAQLDDTPLLSWEDMSGIPQTDGMPMDKAAAFLRQCKADEICLPGQRKWLPEE